MPCMANAPLHLPLISANSSKNWTHVILYSISEKIFTTILYKSMKTLQDLEKASGLYRVKIEHMIDAGLLPPPDEKPQACYSDETFKTILRELQENPLYTISRACQEIGLSENQIRQMLRAKACIKPWVPLNKRKYYCREDLPVLKRQWEEYKNKVNKKPSERWQAEGWFSLTDVARLANVSQSTLQHHIRLGTIKPPSHRSEKWYRYNFYNRQEKDRILRFIEKRREELPFMRAAEKIKGKPRTAKRKWNVRIATESYSVTRKLRWGYPCCWRKNWKSCVTAAIKVVRRSFENWLAND